MSNKTRFQRIKRMALGIILVLSIAVNIVLAVNYRELAIQQNLAWSNGITQVMSVLVRLSSDYQENISQEGLTAVNGHIEMLSQQLQTATLLPYGQEIIPFPFIQKTNSFLNYERKVVQLMQNELNQSGHISNENRQRGN